MSHHYLRFSNVSYHYYDGHSAIQQLSFVIGHGEKVALVGANGAGKSTLLMLMSGQYLPSAGEIEIGGVRVVQQNLPRIRERVGVVFQDSDNQLFMSTVEEDVRFGPTNMQLTEEEITQRTDFALATVGALNLKQRTSHRLSGGEKRRVAIASVLAMSPDILLMDEPTANLDPHARRQTMELIGSFFHTVVLATHDLDMVSRLCDRTMILHHGRIVADGTPAELFSDEKRLMEWGL